MSCVLVIDDDPMVREVVRDVLESAGFEVLEAPDGEEGLRTFIGNGVDLVIVDLEMPRVSGKEVIREVRLRKPETNIIALTSFAHAAFGDVAIIGVARIYVKPFRIKELLQTAETLLGRNPDRG